MRAHSLVTMVTSVAILCKMAACKQCTHEFAGRGYYAGLRVTKRNKATVLLTLTLFQTPTQTPNPNPYPNPNLTLPQVCF
jgi:hypothetical protein